MNKQIAVPTHDATGLNIVAPNDRSGHKLAYITELHHAAMQMYYPRGTGMAVDVGCGFGRLTGFLKELGYGRVVGVDPDSALIEHASLNSGDTEFLVGGLPHLPIPSASAELMVLHNVLRPLKQLGKLDAFSGIRGHLQPGGHLVVVDNVWPGRDDYWTCAELESLLTQNDFEIRELRQLRGGRWWLGRLYSAGLLPSDRLKKYVHLELSRRANCWSFSRWEYINTLWICQAR